MPKSRFAVSVEVFFFAAFMKRTIKLSFTCGSFCYVLLKIDTEEF
jgi:hypothetical protein